MESYSLGKPCRSASPFQLWSIRAVEATNFVSVVIIKVARLGAIVEVNSLVNVSVASTHDGCIEKPR